MTSTNIPENTIFIGGLCNSNCIMCPYTEHFRRNAKSESFVRLKQVIDSMSPDSEYVCITGGEPTILRDDFLRLVEYCRDHFPFALIHILTNGRTFAYRDFLDDFRRVRPYKTLLGIPLHADNSALHDYISQSEGSFDETLRGLDNLYRAGEHIEIRIVTSKLNCENLPGLAKMIAERYPCCRRVCLMGLEMMGNAMINRNDVWCSYGELWPFVREATYILLMKGVETELYNYPLCIVDKSLHPIYRRSITPSKIEYLHECENCRKKNECGGFFRTTKIMPDISVRPY
ncbi:MAG: His-Xaa-Ser system radical SAM maturase HxsC [Synergistaceae bacterium]|nr:His-Xaa-Ser system radical SAM maturase HxsC [Synergistaceae bacterium]MBR0256795.1 His-Xaa-Ser system radical SAM maturase HxsC [Synergistaceae bacterium]